MKRFGQVVLLFLLFSPAAWAQPRKPVTVAELSVYNGSDREQLLYARREIRGHGHLVHFTGGRFLQSSGARIRSEILRCPRGILPRRRQRACSPHD